MEEEEAIVTHNLPTGFLKPTNRGLSKSWKLVKKHQGSYTGGAISLSDDGTFFACLYGADVAFVSVATGEVTSMLQQGVPEQVREEITAFTLRGNDQIITASRNLLIRHWDLKTKTCIKMFKAHETPVLSMTVDPTNTLVATGGSDRAVKVFDIDKGFCTHNFKGHQGIVHTVVFHPDGSRLQLVSLSEDTTIRVWDLVTSTCAAVFTDHLSPPTAVGFSQDGWTMISGGRDRVVNLYDLRRFKLLRTVPVYEVLEGLCVLPHELYPEAVSDRKRIVFATAGEKGKVKTWMVTKSVLETSKDGAGALTCQCLATQEQEGDFEFKYTGLYVAKDKKHIIAPTHDHNLLFISNELKRVRQVIGYNDEVIDIKYIPLCEVSFEGVQEAGKSADVKEPTEDSSGVEDSNDDSSAVEESGSEGVGSKAHKVTESALTSADNSKPHLVAVATNSEQIRLFDLRTFSCDLLAGHKEIVLALDVSPDGMWLATVSKDNTARVWDIPRRKCVAVCVGHTEAVAALSFSRKASAYKIGQGYLMTGSQDKTVKMWDLRPLRLAYHATTQPAYLSAELMDKQLAKFTQKAHDKDINAIAVSPNDRIIATASQDKTVKLWSSEDLKLLGVCRGHKRGVWAVEFSPVDQIIATASGDSMIKLWSVKDFSCVKTFEGHTASVLKLQFLTAGMQLMSSGADGLIKLWTIRTNECETTMDSHTDKVWALAVRSDGQEVVSGGGDSVINIWTDNTAEAEDELMQEEEDKLLKEQDLYNYLREKEYSKALELAFELNRPMRVYGVFQEITEGSSGEGLTPVEGNQRLRSLDKYIVQLSIDHLSQLLRYCREWNTNSRTSALAQAAVGSVLRQFSLDEVSKLEGIDELLDGLLAYSERHFERIDRLVQRTFLIDFTLVSMKHLLPVPISEAQGPSAAIKEKASKDPADDDQSKEENHSAKSSNEKTKQKRKLSVSSGEPATKVTKKKKKKTKA